MMMTFNQLREGGFMVCLPQHPKNIDNGVINRLRGILKCYCGNIVIHAHDASCWLRCHKTNIVDGNGDIVTGLDCDLDRKLVIAGDINLYFALEDECMLDNDCVFVEIDIEVCKTIKAKQI